MTPNTKTLESGLLGLDNGGARPRTGGKGGADGFAEVFDAQVRGAGHKAPAEKPAARPEAAEKAESSRAHDKAPARQAARENGPKGRETDERGDAADTSETARASGDADVETPEATQEQDALDSGTDGGLAEETGETPEQLLAVDGKVLPVEEPVVPVEQGTMPAEQAEPLLAAELPEASAPLAVPVAGVPTDADQDVVDTDLLPADFLRKAMPARSRAEAHSATAQDSKTSERPADDLLAAFRFGRMMMAQERGAEKLAPEIAALTEGQATRRAPDALTSLTGMTAVPGREMGSSPNPSVQAPTSQPIPVPLNRAGWDQAFSERVVWMARQGLQEAHIQVTPREMGPIEVRISVQQDQASVAFAAQNAGAREAIEAAMPRLREMLADSGLNLVQSEVSQQSPQERGDGREPVRAHGNHGNGGGIETHGGLTGEVNPAQGQGLVDYFA